VEAYSEAYQRLQLDQRKRKLEGLLEMWGTGGELQGLLDAVDAPSAAVLCGAISQYNESEPGPGPRNYLNLLLQRGRMEGFIILDYLDRAGEAISQLGRWVEAGEIKVQVDIQEGLENAPRTLRRLFTGANVGKQLLRICES